jgi:hypothetical protein
MKPVAALAWLLIALCAAAQEDCPNRAASEPELT